MRRRFVGIVLLAFILCSVAVVGGDKAGPKAGEHVGEKKQFDAEISFHGSLGDTVTNEEGTFYKVWGYVFFDDKVYPAEYHGTFPLYFFGSRVGAKVKLINHGPRKKAKMRIRTEAYVLLTSGLNGVALIEPQEIDVEVARGETKEVDVSFVAEYNPDAESGLDRLEVKVLHPNEGGESGGNPYPALIESKEAVFCPPEYRGEVQDAYDEGAEKAK